MFTRFWNWVTSRPVVWAVLWMLHVLLVAGITVGLYHLNRRLHLETELLSPVPELHPYWLSGLFLLLYLGAWVGWRFFRLLADPADGSFPDIDAAWKEGLAALTAAGIDPANVPLVVVLGEPAGGADAFFAAAGLALAVRAEPRRPDAPVRVYATRDAVFVTTPGCSAVAAVAATLVPPPSVNGQVSIDADLEIDLLDGPDDLVRPGDAPPPGPPDALPAAADDWLPPADPGPVAGVPADAARRLADRLTHLGKLVAAARRPFCPANGTLWLLPLAATAGDASAEAVAAACRADRVAFEAGFDVLAPAAAVVCDADRLPGFADLLAGLGDGLADGRVLGRTFPLAPAVPADAVAGVWDDGIDWLARHLLPGVAYRRFGTEADGTADRWADANARLWQLAEELVIRRSALSRLVGQGVAGPPGRPPLVTGLYLVGTGPTPADRAFAPGVVKQLLDAQDHVAWTPAAEAAEADCRRVAAVGYAAAVALLLAVAAFGYATWNR